MSDEGKNEYLQQDLSHNGGPAVPNPMGGATLADKFNDISQRMASFNNGLQNLQSPLVMSNQPVSPEYHGVESPHSIFGRNNDYDCKIPAFFESH
jgi:hypothetical protein